MNFRVILAILAVVSAPSCAVAEDMKMNMAANASPAEKALMASMQKMMKGMEARPTGNPDGDFVSMMMPHHQGAIDMAKIELQYGKDPMLRKMASEIIAAQQTELGEMRAWQAKNGR